MDASFDRDASGKCLDGALMTYFGAKSPKFFRVNVAPLGEFLLWVKALRARKL
jgi:hypothetical protein